jgi:hypothetical protein
LPTSVVHCAKCATIVLLAFHLDHAGFQAELARRLGCRIALLGGNPLKCDSDHTRMRTRLASNLDAFGGELDLAYENTGHIAAGTREARHISPRQRIEIDG